MTEFTITEPYEAECAVCGKDLLAGAQAILSRGLIFCSKGHAQVDEERDAMMAEMCHSRHERTVVENKSTQDVFDWSITPSDYPEEYG
jgi:hypothetical protein